MNRHQKEIQQVYLNNEKACLDALKDTYQGALDDIDGKIAELLGRDDANLQHVIYQVEYQKALKKQVEGILDQLQTKNFETVSEYLTACYEDGFIGTMYDLQGQGIPLMIPIDQQQVVDAVMHDTKMSTDLYSSLGKDISKLKKDISSEISRGISQGLMYGEISKNISRYAGVSRNNAMRIARTEGHRIQCTASMNACEKAKSKGADVVKQWDSTLDGRTRDSHRHVDGEIRELDEKFSNGLMFPSDPSGRAEEVINCRCALLQRARWAVDRPFTKWSEDAPVLIDDDGTTQFVQFDSAKDYEEFKKQYMQASDSVSDSVQKMKHFVDAQTIDEAELFARKFVVPDNGLGLSGKISFKGLDLEFANKLNRCLENVFEEYDIQLLSNIKPIPFREKRFRGTTATMAYEWTQDGTIYFNQSYFKSAKAMQAHIDESFSLLETVINGSDVLLKNPNISEVKRKYIETLLRTGVQCVSQESDDFVTTTINHEIGHMLDDKIFRRTFKEVGFDIAESMEKYATGISGYALSSNAEYVAESFALYMDGKISKLDPNLVDIFERTKNEKR